MFNIRLVPIITDSISQSKGNIANTSPPAMVEHNEVTAFGLSNQFLILLGHPGQNVLRLVTKLQLGTFV